MAPPCKIIKYKEGRSGRGAARIKKRSPLPVIPQSPFSASDDPRYFLPAEEDVEEPEERKVEPPPSPLACLRRWLRKQRFIPQDLSDDFLVFFLSACDYSSEAAAKKLEKYFESRQSPSPLFRNRDPSSPENVDIFRKLYVLPMPDTTEDGRKIILTGLTDRTLAYDQMEHAKALAMVFDLLIWEKDFGFGDFAIVLDGRGFECPQLLENKVSSHRSIRSLLLDTIPGTLRSFYLLYPPSHVANVADNRNGIWVTVVRSKQEMIGHLPADVLPSEYGGNLGHLADLLEQWELRLIQSRDFFVRFETKMIGYHRRRLCREREVDGGGKNWVQNMKLVEDEWEYKRRYYERMKTLKLEHPAYGSRRKLNRPKPEPRAKGANPANPFHECWLRAKAEEEERRLEDAIERGRRKMQKSRKEADAEGGLVQLPVLELKIVCPQN